MRQILTAIALLVVAPFGALALVMLALQTGHQQTAQAQRDAFAARHMACLSAEGHYVPSTMGSWDECWSADGTRRLFPWEGQ